MTTNSIYYEPLYYEPLIATLKTELDGMPQSRLRDIAILIVRTWQKTPDLSSRELQEYVRDRFNLHLSPLECSKLRELLADFYRPVDSDTEETRTREDMSSDVEVLKVLFVGGKSLTARGTGISVSTSLNATTVTFATSETHKYLSFSPSLVLSIEILKGVNA